MDSEKRLNVVIIQNITLSKHLGLSTYLKNISRYIKKNNVTLNLIIQQDDNNKLHLAKNVNLYEVQSNLYSIKDNFIFSIKATKLLKKINKNNKVDIIHCLYPSTTLLSAILFKKFLSKNTKIIYDVRSPWIDVSLNKLKTNKNFIKKIYSNIAYKYERFVCKKVDYFIFITQQLKDYYRNKLNMGLDNSIIVPSGIDLDLFKKVHGNPLKDFGINKKDIVLGYIGAIKRERELDFVIEAFDYLCKIDNTKKYWMVFIGSGDDKLRLKSMANSKDSSDKILFIDEVANDSMPQYISNFNYGICHLPDNTTFKYSFPMKILEYAACGVNVLASDIKAHKEIANSIKNVYLYSNKHDFVNFLNQKFNAQNSNLNRFDWNSICTTILGTYKNE